MQYIWKSPWSLGKCLYIASRYFAFADVYVHLQMSFDSGWTPKDCLATSRYIPWFSVIGAVIAEAILIARTFAIYERSYKILTYLVCLRLGTLIPTLKLINDYNRGLKFVESPAPGFSPCVSSGDDPAKIWLAYLFIAILDCNIVALTIWKAGSQWKSGLTGRRLISTLYRDGVAYFMVLCLVSIANVVLLNVQHNMLYFDFLVLFQRVVQAILSSRIIINIRKAVGATSDPSTITDPLVFGDTTDDTYVQSSNSESGLGEQRSDTHIGGLVKVHRDRPTVRNVDMDDIEMN